LFVILIIFSNPLCLDTVAITNVLQLRYIIKSKYAISTQYMYSLRISKNMI
jgi:hypothetical protein